MNRTFDCGCRMTEEGSDTFCDGHRDQMIQQRRQGKADGQSYAEEEVEQLRLENAALKTACDSWQDAVAPGGWVAEMKQKLADLEERLPLLQGVIERLNTEVSDLMARYTNLVIATEFLEAESLDNIKARLAAEKRAARLRTVLGSARVALTGYLDTLHPLMIRIYAILAEERGTPAERES